MTGWQPPAYYIRGEVGHMTVFEIVKIAVDALGTICGLGNLVVALLTYLHTRERKK
jgi:hypothetical protein